MPIYSLSFVLILLPIFILLTNFVKQRAIIFILASILVFSNNPIFLAAVLAIALIDFASLKFITHKAVLSSIITINIAIGIIYSLIHSDGVLVLGISIYILQGCGYLIDCYKGKKPTTDFLGYIAAATYFPICKVGPISSYGRTIKEIREFKFNKSRFLKGLTLYVRGLAKKLIIADSLQLAYQTTTASGYQGLALLNGILLITLILLWGYIELSAYFDMAIGISKMVGIYKPQGHSHPLTAKSISGFFVRLNIPLIVWFNKYLRIKNKFLRIGLFSALIAICYGISANLLICGIYFAIIVMVEFYVKVNSILSRLVTLILCAIGFVFAVCSEPLSLLSTIFTFKHTVDALTVNLLLTNGLSLILACLISFNIYKFLKRKVNKIIHTVVFLGLIIVTITYCYNSPALKEQNGAILYSVEAYLQETSEIRIPFLKLKARLELIQGKNQIGDIYVTNNMLLEDLKLPKKESGTALAYSVNEFCRKYNVNTSLMLIPTAIEFYKQDISLLKNVANQTEYIDSIYKKLNLVQGIDAYAALSAAVNENIFYKTDSHLTSYGAFVCYNALSKALGYKAATHDLFNIEHATNTYLGDLYEKTLYYNGNYDNIDLYHYARGNIITDVMCYNDKNTQTYSGMFFREYLESNPRQVFLGAGDPVIKIKTNANSGKKLLIYSNDTVYPFIQFLSLHYDEIVIIDEKAKTNDINVKEFTQVLFLYDIRSLL